MDQLAGVFLQMNPFNAYSIGLIAVIYDFKESVFTERSLILRDLISLWQVGIKVILPSKPGMPVGGTVQGQSRPDSILDSLFV